MFVVLAMISVSFGFGFGFGKTDDFGGDRGGGGIFPWEWNSLRSDTHSWRKNTPTIPLLLKMVMSLRKALVGLWFDFKSFWTDTVSGVEVTDFQAKPGKTLVNRHDNWR